VVGVLAPALLAGVARPLIRATLILSLPLAISVLVVNLLFFPGGQDVLFRVGPLTATREGLVAAIEVVFRIVAISGGISLFYLTTAPGDLTIDLERRGVSPRIAFVANASIQTVPQMLERATAITAAQRARGLDTEGSLRARLRGVLPIAGPVVLGSIGEVEERTMALEARAFSRPGRRTLLWHPPDSAVQRVARWTMVLAFPVAVWARASGTL
jgi:energy-coupling factor transport system permease protein